MFIDEVTIYVKSGKGGDGVVAFRREKYVPMGGPAGGDGGKGGSIIFKADYSENTLLSYRYKKNIIGKDGENGRNKNQTGATAPDTILIVPLGTTIFDANTGKVIADLTNEGDEVVVAKGGKGGRGNANFATSRNKAPEYAERGEPGEEFNLRLELKVLADVGFVGFPSVGKSTLISKISASKPKIADYHFTTLVPNLGVVSTKDGRTFVAADLPGLIEGASLGEGLGIRFLKHIERTRVIAHIIDMSAFEGRDPFNDYQIINQELESYKLKLLGRPQIIVANKMDVDGAKEQLNKFVKKYKEIYGKNPEIIEISALLEQNLDLLTYKIADVLDETPFFEIYEDEQLENVIKYTFKKKDKGFTVHADPDELVYIVSGPEIDKLFSKTNFNYEESVGRFAQKLRALGVDGELRKIGCKNGDIVRVNEYEFEFID